MMAIVKAKLLVAMLIEWVRHQGRKVQLMKRHIWGRGQYHDSHSEGDN